MPATAMYTSPTGFASVPPSGPGDTCHRNPEVGAQPVPDPLRHGDGHLCRHRAMAGKDGNRYAQELALDLVRVGDCPAAQVGGGARHLGEHVRDEPAGA